MKKAMRANVRRPAKIVSVLTPAIHMRCGDDEKNTDFHRHFLASRAAMEVEAAIWPPEISGMNGANDQSEPTPCTVPFETLVRHALAPEQVTAGERESMLEHLRLCDACSEAYNQIAQAEMDYLAEVQGELAIDTSHISVEQAVADLWRRIDACEAEQARQQGRVQTCRITAGHTCSICTSLVPPARWRRCRRTPAEHFDGRASGKVASGRGPV